MQGGLNCHHSRQRNPITVKLAKASIQLCIAQEGLTIHGEAFLTHQSIANANVNSDMPSLITQINGSMPVTGMGYRHPKGGRLW